MVDHVPLRCGIAGAGRSRQGTGPFLARFVEAAGGRVTGVAGRDAARARDAAGALHAALGHPVGAYPTVADLLATGLDALVIASPDEVHGAALDAALAAGVPVLCEKPLVPAEQHARVAPLLGGFRRRGLLLMEGCQWPLLLPALAPIWRAVGRPPVRFAMRLSPARPGAVALRSSLSHLLSVVQECWPVGAGTALTDLAFSGAGGVEDGLCVDFVLRNDDSRQAVCHLELGICPQQPRPAWIEIDGRRMERHIESGTYRMSFVAGDRKILVDDPTAGLVYRFLELVRDPNLERIQTAAHSIEHRARLYTEIVCRFLGRQT